MTEATRLRPVPGWIRQFTAGKITFQELEALIAKHEFEPRESSRRTHREKMYDAYTGEVGAIEPGTLDDLTYLYGPGLTHNQQVALRRAARLPEEERRNLANPPGLYNLLERDWDPATLLNERPWRLAALLKVRNECSDCRYWRMVREVWLDDRENIDQNLEKWQELWQGREYISEMIMDEDDWDVWSELPDPVIVYRGYQGEQKKGLWWTLSLETARRLAQRSGQSKVAGGLAHKRDVLAYFGGRGDGGLVIMPDKVDLKGERHA